MIIKILELFYELKSLLILEDLPDTLIEELPGVYLMLSVFIILMFINMMVLVVTQMYFRNDNKRRKAKFIYNARKKQKLFIYY